MIRAILEIEYDTDSVEEAKAFARADADRLFSQERVLAIAADSRESYLKDAAALDMPITERYLTDVGLLSLARQRAVIDGMGQGPMA